MVSGSPRIKAIGSLWNMRTRICAGRCRANATAMTKEMCLLPSTAPQKVLAPGYVPASYCGFELGGYDGNARYNPATAYGITYYIIAPRCEWNVDVFVDGKYITSRAPHGMSSNMATARQRTTSLRTMFMGTAG